jgi:hypothetical protein
MKKKPEHVINRALEYDRISVSECSWRQFSRSLFCAMCTLFPFPHTTRNKNEQNCKKVFFQFNISFIRVSSCKIVAFADTVSPSPVYISLFFRLGVWLKENIKILKKKCIFLSINREEGEKIFFHHIYAGLTWVALCCRFGWFQTCVEVGKEENIIRVKRALFVIGGWYTTFSDYIVHFALSLFIISSSLRIRDKYIIKNHFTFSSRWR